MIRMHSRLSSWLLGVGVVFSLCHSSPSLAEKKCRLQIDPGALHLGESDQAIIAALGQPVAAAVEHWQPTTWNLYDVRHERWLKYGWENRGGYAGFAVYRFESFLLNADRSVIGYILTISNHPNKLQSVNEAIPWAAKTTWDKVHLTNTEAGSQNIIASVECGRYVLILQAGCFPFAGTDPDTYRPTTVIPRSLGECRFRGLSVFDLRASQPSGVQYRPTSVPPPAPANQSPSDAKLTNQPPFDARPTTFLSFADLTKKPIGSRVRLHVAPSGIAVVPGSEQIYAEPCDPKDPAISSSTGRAPEVWIVGVPKETASAMNSDNLSSCDRKAPTSCYFIDATVIRTGELTRLTYESSALSGTRPYDARIDMTLQVGE